MPKTRKNNKHRKKGGSNNSVRRHKNNFNLSAMKNNKVVNFSKPDSSTRKVFIGKPWTGNTMKRAPDTGAKVEYPSNYYKQNDRFLDPQQFLTSSPNVLNPPLVTAPHGYLHAHKHYHPHTGGKRKKRTHKKKRHGKKTRKTMKGGFGKSRFFQDLVNLFRDLGHSFTNIGHGIAGYPPEISPSPTVQPIDKIIPAPYNVPPNIKRLHRDAEKKVLSI